MMRVRGVEGFRVRVSRLVEGGRFRALRSVQTLNPQP